MKLGALLICLLLSVGGAHSQANTNQATSLLELKPSITTIAPAPISSVSGKAANLLTPKPVESNSHYIGVGLSNTANFLTRPVLHPVKTFNQLTFPMRHPLMAFKKFGEIVAPYQSALNGVSALSGPVTAAGVFAIKR